MTTIVDLKTLHQRFLTAIKTDKVLLQRCSKYCLEKKGKSLVDFLSNGASPEDKVAMMTELVTIVESGDYSRLPGAPGGQAVDVGTPAAPRPVPAAAPAPKPEPKPEVPSPTVTPAGNSAVADLVAAVKAKKEAAAKAAAEAEAKAAAAKVPALTEEKVAEKVAALIHEAISNHLVESHDEDRIRALIQEELSKALAPLIATLSE